MIYFKANQFVSISIFTYTNFNYKSNDRSLTNCIYNLSKIMYTATNYHPNQR